MCAVALRVSGHGTIAVVGGASLGGGKLLPLFPNPNSSGSPGTVACVSTTALLSGMFGALFSGVFAASSVCCSASVAGGASGCFAAGGVSDTVGAAGAARVKGAAFASVSAFSGGPGSTALVCNVWCKDKR